LRLLDTTTAALTSRLLLSLDSAVGTRFLHVRWICQSNNLMVELCPIVTGESNLKFYIIEGTGSRVHGSCEGNLCIVFQVDGSRGCDKKFDFIHYFTPYRD
jgi:hypothetical protein